MTQPDLLFKALADPSRRQLERWIRKFDKPRLAALHHLKRRLEE